MSERTINERVLLEAEVERRALIRERLRKTQPVKAEDRSGRATEHEAQQRRTAR